MHRSVRCLKVKDASTSAGSTDVETLPDPASAQKKASAQHLYDTVKTMNPEAKVRWYKAEKVKRLEEEKCSKRTFSDAKVYTNQLHRETNVNDAVLHGISTNKVKNATNTPLPLSRRIPKPRNHPNSRTAMLLIPAGR